MLGRILIAYRWEACVMRRLSGGRPDSFWRKGMRVHFGSPVMILAMVLYAGSSWDKM